jgi:hypothetical protein
MTHEPLRLRIAALFVSALVVYSGAAVWSEPAESTTGDGDWLIVPGIRVGQVGQDASENSLRKAYGAGNVTRVEVPLGEGETEQGTAVFAGDADREIRILWRDTVGSKNPKVIHVKGRGWRTEEGVGLGSSLKELERLNGRPFQITGFGWDYSGTIVSWEGGRLEALQSAGRVLLRLIPEQGANYDELLGDGAFSSDHPQMQKLNPTAYAVIFNFPDTDGAIHSIDQRLQEQIIGTWFATDANRTIAFELHTGGLIVVRIEARTNVGHPSGIATGGWWLDGNRFKGRIENSTLREFPVGHTWSDEVVGVSEQSLVLKNTSGQIESYQRR